MIGGGDRRVIVSCLVSEAELGVWLSSHGGRSKHPTIVSGRRRLQRSHRPEESSGMSAVADTTPRARSFFCKGIISLRPPRHGDRWSETPVLGDAEHPRGLTRQGCGATICRIAKRRAHGLSGTG